MTDDARVPTEYNLSISQPPGGQRRGRFPPFLKTALSAFLSLSLVSCANEDEQFQRQMQQIFSWSASAEMVLNARIGTNVPESFTDRAVEKCQKEISDLASQLPQTVRTAHARVAVLKLNGLISAAHDEIVHGRLERGHQHIAELHRYQAEQRSTLGADG